MLDFNRFEIFTFDCYGTLINWEAGILSALHKILAAYGKKVDDAKLLKLYGEFEQAHSIRIAKFCNRWFAASERNSVLLLPRSRRVHYPIRCLRGSHGPILSKRFGD
jgi:beta-phosphoglucomutase-like phosphatase (HAD superfamily)